jgi:hypothetical protein
MMGSIPTANDTYLPLDYSGVIGDAYLATDTGDLWVWSDDGTWHDMGKIVGPEGPQGTKGNTGDTGKQGETGNTGGQGEQGAHGLVGEPGPDGPTGKEGLKGETGHDGPKGDGWTQGYYTASDGIVTFVSADNLGFKTTDIRGDKGDTGLDGPQGGIGVTGNQGPTGEQGIDGPQGDQGIEGSPGAGIHFHDSVPTQTDLPGWPDLYGGDVGDAYMTEDTGDLWVWTESKTWIDMGHIVGPIGPQGVVGDQGPDGPKGDEGEHGVHGEPGVHGDPGEKGETGDIGLPGSDGLSGEDGVDGNQGLPGAPGLDGNDGADSVVQGPIGGVGPIGPSGEDGVDGNPQTPNSILPSHLNVPGTLRGQGMYSLDDTETYAMTGDDGQQYIYMATEREGVSQLNDLTDVSAINRQEGTTIAWDGQQYVTAFYPDQGVQGPIGDQGEIGPDGIRGPRGEEGPVGEQGPQGPAGSVGIPSGGIIMWSGSLVQIPPTWLLCDGTGTGLNKTPDLRDKFIMGAGNKDIGVTGGGTSGSTKISIAQMPSHDHQWSTSSGSTTKKGDHTHIVNDAGAHSHNMIHQGQIVTDWRQDTVQVGTSQYVYSVSSYGQWRNEPDHWHSLNYTGDHGHIVSASGTTTSRGSGSGHTHTVEPSYYTLAYIMKEYN